MEELACTWATFPAQDSHFTARRSWHFESAADDPRHAPGLFATSSYETLTLRLQPGDSVIFCTGGMTDAFDDQWDAFGIEQLQELCDAHRRAAPGSLLGGVSAAVESFARGRGQHDDMAAVPGACVHKNM